MTQRNFTRLAVLLTGMAPVLAQDECSNAVTLPVFPLQQLTLDTTGATSSGPWAEATHAYPDVWFEMPAGSIGNQLVLIRVDGDATIEVHEGSCSGPVVTTIDGANANHGALTLLTFQRRWPHENYMARIALRDPAGGAVPMRVNTGYFNDTCSSALELQLNAEYRTGGGLTSALTGQPWPCEPSVGQRRDYWYRFRVDETGDHVLFLSDQSTTTQPDALVEVLEGGCGTVNSVACVNLDDTPFSAAELDFHAVAGVDYLVRFASEGTGRIELARRPDHDSCESAQVIDVGTHGYNTYAARDSSWGPCSAAEGGAHWFRFDPPSDGVLFHDNSENTGTGYLGDCGSLNPVVCHHFGDWEAQVAAGQPVYLRMPGDSNPVAPPGLEGSVSIDFSPFAPRWERIPTDGPSVSLTPFAAVGDKLIARRPESTRYRLVIYDTVLDQWLVRDPSVLTPSHSGVAHGDEYVVAGGVGPGNKMAVETFDTTTWASTVTHTDTVNRSGVAAVSLPGRIVFAGGNSGGVNRDAVDVYLEETDTWVVTRLPFAASNLVPVVVGRSVYFFAASTSVSEFVQVLDVDTLQWTVLAGPAPLAVGSTRGAVRFGSDVLVALEATDKVAVLDSLTGTWSVLDMPKGLRPEMIAVEGDELLMSGRPVSTSGRYPHEVLVYSFATGLWREDTVWLPRSAIGAVSTRNGTYVLGGESSAAGFGTLGYRYQPVEADFVCSPAVPNATGLPASIHANGSQAVAQNELRLTASGMPQGSLGFFIVGTQSGFTQPAISAGPICVGGMIGRYSAPSQIFEGPVGMLTLDLGAVPTTPATAVAPGDTLTFQAWFRDPVQTSNLTDAISITFE